MKIVKADFEIIDDIDSESLLKKIERIGRLCYKSEDKITDNSCHGFVRGLIRRNHLAMLEHFSLSVFFRTDRGVTHEVVRHRIASFAQESTRYCNYLDDKFNNNVTIISPDYWNNHIADSPRQRHMKEESVKIYLDAAKVVEDAYFKLLELGNSPQQARIVLMTGTKSDIVVTANLREWMHIMNLRAVGTTGAPHPQMLEIMRPLLYELQCRIPVVFDDINY